MLFSKSNAVNSHACLMCALRLSVSLTKSLLCSVIFPAVWTKTADIVCGGVKREKVAVKGGGRE